MPAPENLNPQTPGTTPQANAANETTTGTTSQQTEQPRGPAYEPKHNGGGRWIVIDANAPKVDGKEVRIGDFVGDKAEAEAEAARLAAGGEPLSKPARETPGTTPQVETVDPKTITRPVLTEAGWIVPEK